MASRGGAQRPNGTQQGKVCQFKLVLLGESAVGKSSLVLRFVKGQFHEFQESTIGGKYGFMLQLFLYVFTCISFSDPSQIMQISYYTVFIALLFL